MADAETKLMGREQVKQLTDRLAEGVKELFASEKYADYLRALPKMHKYSPRNALLIQMQMPGASLVAGYQTWQSKYGRFVKQGERGIKILAPAPFTIKKEQQRLDPVTRQPILGLDGLPETEMVEQKLARFKATTVFDVSQTDGKPLPTLVEELTGDVRHYEIFLETLRAVSPLPIAFENLPADTDGVCRYGDKIAIRVGMSEIQAIAAIIHEITHAKLHDKALRDENAPPKDRRTQEVEAESVAFAVCAKYGIETDANSFGYVASWSSGKELKELTASHEIIHHTAAELIDSIDAAFKRLAKERGVDLSAGTEAPERGAERAEQDAVPAAGGDTPGSVYAFYCNRIARAVGQDPLYIEAITGADADAARIACDAAVQRAVMGQLMESTDHLRLYNQYMSNPDFKARIEDYTFIKAYLEPQNATREGERPKTPGGNARAHENFDKFEELFPQIASGEYRYMRFEGDAGMEPLHVQYVGSDQVSIMHTYTANGDLCYDPDIVASLDKDNRTLNAVSFEQSIPPLYQRVDENGDGQSVDGNGNESTIRGLQNHMNYFLLQWFSNIGQQNYIPVSAVQVIDGEDMEITFDAAGIPIQPEAEQNIEKAPDTAIEASEPEIGPMPDPSIGRSERDLFGYKDDEMLPLTQYRAMELFDGDHTVYLLHPDNTEAMAFTAEEISQHDGLFGIERVEWLASPEYERMKTEAATIEAARESSLLYGGESRFGIYQLRSDASNSYSWASMKELEADGLTVERANYELVHTAPLTIRDTQASLHKIYDDYNCQPPEDFRGHSPSVSDVIVLQLHGAVSSHYVDSFGFTALPAFTGAEGKESEITQSQAPATDYTSSQLGNTIDPAQPVETKAADTENAPVPDVSASPPQQGEIPTVAELTAKAEAGEQISVMALLAAIKREQSQATPAKETAPFKEAPGQHTERGID